MANIQLIELRSAETPIEDLSCEAANNILGGTCPGEGGGVEFEGGELDGFYGFFLIVPVGGRSYNLYSAYNGEYFDTITIEPKW